PDHRDTPAARVDRAAQRDAVGPETQVHDARGLLPAELVQAATGVIRARDLDVGHGADVQAFEPTAQEGRVLVADRPAGARQGDLAAIPRFDQTDQISRLVGQRPDFQLEPPGAASESAA